MNTMLSLKTSQKKQSSAPIEPTLRQLVGTTDSIELKDATDYVKFRGPVRDIIRDLGQYPTYYVKCTNRPKAKVLIVAYQDDLDGRQKKIVIAKKVVKLAAHFVAHPVTLPAELLDPNADFWRILKKIGTVGAKKVIETYITDPALTQVAVRICPVEGEYTLKSGYGYFGQKGEIDTPVSLKELAEQEITPLLYSRSQEWRMLVDDSNVQRLLETQSLKEKLVAAVTNYAQKNRQVKLSLERDDAATPLLSLVPDEEF